MVVRSLAAGHVYVSTTTLSDTLFDVPAKRCNENGSGSSSRERRNNNSLNFSAKKRYTTFGVLDIGAETLHELGPQCHSRCRDRQVFKSKKHPRSRWTSDMVDLILSRRHRRAQEIPITKEAPKDFHKLLSSGGV